MNWILFSFLLLLGVGFNGHRPFVLQSLSLSLPPILSHSLSLPEDCSLSFPGRTILLLSSFSRTNMMILLPDSVRRRRLLVTRLLLLFLLERNADPADDEDVFDSVNSILVLFFSPLC